MGNRVSRRKEPLGPDDIPLEIIFEIAEQLALEVYAPYDRIDPGNWIGKNRASRNDLQHLCKVSRRILLSAQRALYQTILIEGSDTLVYLYRSILNNPELGTYVKRFLIDDLNSHSIDLTPLHSCNNNGFDRYWTQCPLYKANLIGFNHYGMSNWLGLTLHLKVLNHTPNVRSLDLTIPPCYSPSLEDLHFIPAASAAQAFSSLWDVRSLPPLPMLETLHLQVACCDMNSHYEHRDKVVERLLKAFLALPRVRNLVWSLDEDSWGSIMQVPNRLQHVMSTTWKCKSITSLELSRCLPSELITICAFFPHLNALSVRVDILDETPVPDPALDTGGVFLSDAISGLTHLQELTLDFENCRYFREILGASGTLCLRSLNNLQTLEVPVQVFIKGNPGDEYELLGPAAALPQSLRSLSLMADEHSVEVSQPHHPLQTQIQPTAVVLDFMEELCETGREGFPHLRDVSYHEAYPHHLADGDYRPHPVPQSGAPRLHASAHRNYIGWYARFQALSQSFARGGLRFRMTKKPQSLRSYLDSL